MKAVYTKCKHGNLVKDCILCEREIEEAKMEYLVRTPKSEKAKIPIYRGCPNQTCFCTGRCKEIVGYYE